MDGVLDLYMRNDKRPASAAVPLIIDTDMAFDVDDVLAVCMAHALHDLGEAKLLAVVHDSGYPEGIGAVSVLNHYYGHDDEVALGAYKGTFGKDLETSGREWKTGPYVPLLVNGWPSPVKSSEQVPEAVALYRRLLAAADDSSVAIASVGFATNLEALLKSPADAISPLTGKDLVAKKVKVVVYQGGFYPPRHTQKEIDARVPNDEFNWGCGRRWFYPLDGCEGTASYVTKNMPSNVEQIFSEVGFMFPTGQTLLQCATETNPCRQALVATLQDWNQDPSNGRASWDAIVTLTAVRGATGVGGHKGGVGGKNMVDDGGTNHWVPGTGSTQSYLVLEGDAYWKKMDEDIRAGHGPPTLTEMKDEINRLLCRPPVER